MTEFAGTPELAGVRRDLLREPLFIFDNSWMSSNTVCCAPIPTAVLCVDTSLRPLPDFKSPLSAVALHSSGPVSWGAGCRGGRGCRLLSSCLGCSSFPAAVSAACTPQPDPQKWSIDIHRRDSRQSLPHKMPSKGLISSETTKSRMPERDHTFLDQGIRCPAGPTSANWRPLC